MWRGLGTRNADPASALGAPYLVLGAYYDVHDEHRRVFADADPRRRRHLCAFQSLRRSKVQGVEAPVLGRALGPAVRKRLWCRWAETAR